MSAVKTVALGVVVWALLGISARADALSSSVGSWTYFYGGSAGSPKATRATTFPVVSSPSPSPSFAPSISIPSPDSNTVVTSSPVFTSASNPDLGTASRASVTVAQRTTSSASNVQAYDAFVNLTNFGFIGAGQLATGTPLPWYDSPNVTRFYNGSTPSQSEQADFENKVLQGVQHTFSLANLNPSITLDPNAPANHTLSVISGASYGPNPNAIGITDVGHSGLGFIDKFTYADSVDQLATAVAKNVAHELMHAFGVAKHSDESGAYVDAAMASWPLLTNADSTFSPAAVKAINDTHFGPYGGDFLSGSQVIEGAQEIVKPVPEPLTVVLWGASLAGFVVYRHRKSGPA